MTSATAHLHTLIAHYLGEHYPAVLPAFLHAAAVPPPDLTSPPNPDLRTLVTDYLSHQISTDLGHVQLDAPTEPPATDGSWRNWTVTGIMRVPMESSTQLVVSPQDKVVEGISAANLLTVAVHDLPQRQFDTATAMYKATKPRRIVTTSVDKTVKVIDWGTGEVEQILEPSRAAVLAVEVHPVNPRYILTGSMDGSTVLTDLVTSTALQTFPSGKFVVRVKFSSTGKWFATASYDHHVVIYEATAPAIPPPLGEDDIPLDETDAAEFACDPELRYVERHRIPVGSNPEAVLFSADDRWVMYTLRDSHLLYYVRLPTVPTRAPDAMDDDEAGAAGVEGPAWEALSKSFNPHPMDTHVSFSVLDLALHPSGRVLACLTGDHRGAAGERILLYGVEPDESQTERLACLWTGGEGDDYVLPRMAWLPDGSGIVTTTPTGYLNLVSLAGERRSSVKVHGATELGQGTSEVVRDCCIVPLSPATNLQGDSSSFDPPPHASSGFVVVSVGYDRRVRFTRLQ